MPRPNSYWVYIMANPWRTLYVGVTNDLARRVHQHRERAVPGFTAKYGLTQPVWYEETTSVEGAIIREKQVKGWIRARKLALIESINPDWRDLSAEGADPSLRSG